MIETGIWQGKDAVQDTHRLETGYRQKQRYRQSADSLQGYRLWRGTVSVHLLFAAHPTLTLTVNIYFSALTLNSNKGYTSQDVTGKQLMAWVSTCFAARVSFPRLSCISIFSGFIQHASFAHLSHALLIRLSLSLLIRPFFSFFNFPAMSLN